MENQKDKEKRLEQIIKLLEIAGQDLDKIRDCIIKLQNESKSDEYKNMPGLEGVFDGIAAVISTGEKIEVPANYAAKSRLVYGDVLKVIEEDGKKIFKQLQKVPRKKLEGIVTKKEGRWYVLTDSGSYRISDVAAEFNKLQINDQIIVIIPENNLNAPYASLDKVLTPKEQTPAVLPSIVIPSANVPTANKPKDSFVKSVKKPMPNKNNKSDKKSNLKPVTKPVEPKNHAEASVTNKVSKNDAEHELDLTKREFVMDIKPSETHVTPKQHVVLDDDDLR